MTRLRIAGPQRGGGAAGEGYHPGFFRKGVFFKKIKYVKTRKSNKRKNFGETPAAVVRPCPEPDGVRSIGLKRQRPACGNDDKRTGNQVSGLRWRVHENVVNRLDPVLAFDTTAVCPAGPSEQLRGKLRVLLRLAAGGRVHDAGLP